MIAVLLLIISTSHGTTATPIYFASMEACEAVIPSVLRQAREGVTVYASSAICYEEAAK